ACLSRRKRRWPSIRLLGSFIVAPNLLFKRHLFSPSRVCPARGVNRPRLSAVSRKPLDFAWPEGGNGVAGRSRRSTNKRRRRTETQGMRQASALPPALQFATTMHAGCEAVSLCSRTVLLSCARAKE